MGANAHISSSLRVIQKQTNDANKPVKAAVFVIDRNALITENPGHITENMVGFVIKIGGLQIGIINVYLDKDRDIDEDLLRIDKIIGDMNTDKVLLGGDFNAKSPWWGCSEMDARGVKIAEFMAQWDLYVVNEGNTPTFCATRKESQYKSIVDVTLCTSNLLYMIHGWQVDPDLVTLSDHRALKYKVMIKGDTNNVAQRNSTRVYNTSKAKWNNFTKHLTF